MGETLQMASEKGAYTFTDEGTYLSYKSNLKLVPLITQGSSLLNIYSVMTVYNDKQPVEKIKMANNFVNFLISNQTQADIGNFVILYAFCVCVHVSLHWFHSLSRMGAVQSLSGR